MSLSRVLRRALSACLLLAAPPAGAEVDPFCAGLPVPGQGVSQGRVYTRTPAGDCTVRALDAPTAGARFRSVPLCTAPGVCRPPGPGH